jgi:hypothetical protein
MKALKRRRGDWRGKSESGSYRVIRPPPIHRLRLRRRRERPLLLTRISK